MSELNMSRGDGYGTLLRLFDELAASGIGEFGGAKGDKDPLIDRAARLYHAIADVRDILHSSLPDEAEEALVTGFGTFLADEKNLLLEALKSA